MELKELEKYPIITKSTIKKIIDCNDNYGYTVLNRLLNRKRIKKIIKGKYTVLDDIHIISTNIFSPCYLSFWSCSYFLGYTEQIINSIDIVTTREIRNIEFENYKIRFKKIPKKMFFGYKKIKYKDHFIFIAEDEKLLIDCVFYEDFMGNFDEIMKVFKASSIEIEKLILYLKKINNKSLIKRVGFLLEKFKGIDISKKIDYKDKNIILLSKLIKANKINKKWQVKHDL